MVHVWNDAVPIYRQLRDRVVAMILDGELKEGEAVPSVRQVAVDFQINPLTVSKSYQELVDEDLLEKRRGLGLFVREGARERATGLAGSDHDQVVGVACHRGSRRKGSWRVTRSAAHRVPRHAGLGGRFLQCPTLTSCSPASAKP